MIPKVIFYPLMYLPLLIMAAVGHAIGKPTLVDHPNTTPSWAYAGVLTLLVLEMLTLGFALGLLL